MRNNFREFPLIALFLQHTIYTILKMRYQNLKEDHERMANQFVIACNAIKVHLKIESNAALEREADLPERLIYSLKTNNGNVVIEHIFSLQKFVEKRLKTRLNLDFFFYAEGTPLVKLEKPFVPKGELIDALQELILVHKSK